MATRIVEWGTQRGLRKSLGSPYAIVSPLKCIFAVQEIADDQGR